MIAPFRGQYFFLSNFSPAVINYEGIWYPTSEHAYQAAKTLNKSERFAICRLKKAYLAKNYGRMLKIRPGWDNLKIDIMTDIVRIKFSISELRGKLLDTGDEDIVEVNKHGDDFWGVCGKLNNGRNNLGIILMQVRQEIRESYGIV